MTPEQQHQIQAFIDRNHAAQTAFLPELVEAPSDNPPGDCAPHAERAAEFLAAMGYEVERHPVPTDIVPAKGMIMALTLADLLTPDLLANEAA